MYKNKINRKKKQRTKEENCAFFHRISIGRAHGLIKIIKIFNQEEGGLQ